MAAITRRGEYTFSGDCGNPNRAYVEGCCDASYGAWVERSAQ